MMQFVVIFSAVVALAVAEPADPWCVPLSLNSNAPCTDSRLFLSSCKGTGSATRTHAGARRRASLHSTAPVDRASATSLRAVKATARCSVMATCAVSHRASACGREPAWGTRFRLVKQVVEPRSPATSARSAEASQSVSKVRGRRQPRLTVV